MEGYKWNRHLVPYSPAYGHQCISSSTSCFEGLSSKRSNKVHALFHTSVFHT